MRDGVVVVVWRGVGDANHCSGAALNAGARASLDDRPLAAPRLAPSPPVYAAAGLDVGITQRGPGAWHHECGVGAARPLRGRKGAVGVRGTGALVGEERSYRERWTAGSPGKAGRSSAETVRASDSSAPQAAAASPTCCEGQSTAMKLMALVSTSGQSMNWAQVPSTDCLTACWPCIAAAGSGGGARSSQMVGRGTAAC